MICMNHYIIFGYNYRSMETMFIVRVQQLKSRFPDRGSARGLFEDAKEKLYDKDVSDKDRAVCFYIINKCSLVVLLNHHHFQNKRVMQTFQ